MCVEKLRSILRELEAESIFGSHNIISRKKRVLKVREGMKRIARKESRKFCNCKTITVADSWHLEKFAAEMQIPCPIHGPCRLGVIVSVGGYLTDGDPRDKKLAELISEYHRQSLAYRKAQVNLDDA